MFVYFDGKVTWGKTKRSDGGRKVPLSHAHLERTLPPSK